MRGSILSYGLANIKQLWKPSIWLLTGLLVVMISYGILTNPRIYSFDARYYWELRLAFWDDHGDFSILNYSDEQFQLRGYLFPLFLLISEWLIDFVTIDRWVDDYATVVILNSILLLCVSWGLIPAIFSRLTGRKNTTVFRLILSSLLAFFWRGQLYYPLSDIPALFFLILGLLLITRVLQTPVGWQASGAAFMAGAALMATYVIRPVYLLVYLAVLVGLILSLAARHIRQRILHLLAFLLAGALILTPQYMINRMHYGENSPFISGGLYSYQTTVGFLVQRYEANTGDLTYPAGVRFIDPQAENLLLQAGRNLPFDTETIGAFDVESVLMNALSISDLLGFFWNYPLDMITIYFRHIFNGLSLIYPTTYIESIYRPDLVLMWLNYTILFVVLIFFDARPLFARGVLLSSFILFAWLLPVVTSIPGAVEARYFLPLHALLDACFVSILTDVNSLKVSIERFGRIRLLILYVFFLLMAFSLSGLILTTVPQTTLLLTPR